MHSSADEARRGEEHTTRRDVLRGLSAGGLSLAGVSALGSARAASGSDPLTVIHGSQFHGRFGRPKQPAIPRYAAVVEELREEYSNGAFLATGDDIAKAPLATFFRGKHVIDAMNYLDPLAGAIGNHEFDYSAFLLRRRMASSSFPWVSANLLAGRNRAIPEGRRWVTGSVGDLKVGVLGLSVLDLAHYLYYPQGYRIGKPTAAARTAVEGLDRAGVDYVVCASHLRLNDSKAVARAVDGIDLMVGDHAEHVLDAPLEIEGTVIDSVGAQFDRVGRVSVDGDGLADYGRIPVTPRIDPDPGMRRIVRRWRRRYEVENPLGEDVTVPLPP
jgi:2',3'-cyclic-nucleotide 2'-phosphodiesterase (5'-nucleotidase family)